MFVAKKIWGWTPPPPHPDVTCLYFFTSDSAMQDLKVLSLQFGHLKLAR